MSDEAVKLARSLLLEGDPAYHDDVDVLARALIVADDARSKLKSALREALEHIERHLTVDTSAGYARIAELRRLLL